jgi:ubiquinone/menaquinone biosynthesis C-methylase UbiE
MAFGEGYGSYIISKEAKYVIGVDVDENAVEHARKKYNAQNLEFIQGTILEVPIQEKGKFDVIICFEAIEHVEEHEKLLSEVKRLLHKDGVLIISSPNKKTYSDIPDFNNPFHKKELYFEDFKDLLPKYFKNSVFLGQKVYGVSNIWSIPPSLHPNYKEFIIEKKEDEFYFSDIDKKNPLYFIAISSDKKLNRDNYIISSQLLDVSNILIESFEKQVSTLVNTLQAKDVKINALEINLQEKNMQVSELNELKNTLQSMQQSILWRLLTWYQKNFVERALPHGTGRRRLYDTVLKRGRLL